MKRKSAYAVIAVLAAFAIVSGCAAAGNGHADTFRIEKPMYEWGKVQGETITIWGDSNDLVRPYMTRVFENYEAATGNTIKVVGLSKDELNSKLPVVFSKSGADRPDLLLSYGGTNLDRLNPDENFYDFTNEVWVDDLTDTALNQAVYNAKVIGLPHGEASVSGTLYNKDIFKKYNIAIPETQAEFMAVCETLLQNGITPMYLPYAEITMLLYQFPMDSVLKNKTVLEDLNSGALSYARMPEMRKIIDWYKTMADCGYFGTNYTKNNWDGMDGAMQSGRYAMMLCWDTWLYTSFSGRPESIGLMPAFIGVPENGCFEGANVVLLLANKQSQKLDAALDFIRFAADPYNYNQTFAGLYTAPIYKTQVGNITTPQYVAAERLVERHFYDSTAWSRVKGFSQIDATYIQSYMQGECTAEECLEGMDAARIKRAGAQPQN